MDHRGRDPRARRQQARQPAQPSPRTDQECGRERHPVHRAQRYHRQPREGGPVPGRRRPRRGDRPDLGAQGHKVRHSLPRARRRGLRAGAEALHPPGGGGAAQGHEGPHRAAQHHPHLHQHQEHQRGPDQQVQPVGHRVPAQHPPRQPSEDQQDSHREGAQGRRPEDGHLHQQPGAGHRHRRHRPRDTVQQPQAGDEAPPAGGPQRPQHRGDQQGSHRGDEQRRRPGEHGHLQARPQGDNGAHLCAGEALRRPG